MAVYRCTICGAIIDEEKFPNFYELYTNGYHWVNNYSPRNSCATGNNEFSAMTSLYSIYNTCTSNTYKDNKYYESIFGLFNDKGYEEVLEIVSENYNNNKEMLD